MSRRKHDDVPLDAEQWQQLRDEIVEDDAIEDAEWWIVGEPEAYSGESGVVNWHPHRKRGTGGRRLRKT